MSKETLDQGFYRAALLEAAKRHISALSDEQRTALIEEALRDELEEVDVGSIVTPLIEQYAKEKTRELLRLDEFDKRFSVAIRAGVESFLAALPKVTAVAMVGLFTGIKEYNSGSIHAAFKTLIESAEKKRDRRSSDTEIPF